MTNYNKQRLQEEQEDAALKLLMEEYAEIEGAALWQEFQAAEAAGNDPDSLDREDRNPGRRSTRSNRPIPFLKFLGKEFKRAAAIFLVLICLLSPLVISVEAFKIPVINYFVTLKQTFSAFDFGENVGMISEQETLVNLIRSAPSPEGCTFFKQEITTDGKIVISFEQEGKLALTTSLYPSKGQINIDTEDVTQIPMKVHNYEAVYLQKDGYRIMWVDAKRELVFDVYGLDVNENIFWRYVYGLIPFLL